MSNHRFKTAIHWFRRDLRTDDNVGLSQARELAENVIPIYIADHAFDKRQPGSDFRFNFRHGCLEELATDIAAIGSKLIVLQGDSVKEITSIAKQLHADLLVFNRSYEPQELKRDQRVTEAMHSGGVEVLTFKDQLLIEPDELIQEKPGGYAVYTPFRKAVLNHKLGDPVTGVREIISPRSIHDIGIKLSDIQPTQNSKPIIEPGAKAGIKRLNDFAKNCLEGYPSGRDMLGDEGTSMLSAYLNIGAISARTAAKRVHDLPGSEKWISELIWREFYAHILYNFPHAEHGPLRAQFNGIAWRNDADEFDAWKRGMTGYPVVDAAMRQLTNTGWMHNRARMIVASFLTKDLLINWQWGEKHFMEYLTDGDLAQNNGSWQWCAGTGTDAQPYFRIFNPILQSRKFDPDGSYIRKWAPELAELPNEFIHAPWEMSAMDQECTNCKIGKDYPAPIVDHSVQREITLAAYKLSAHSD